MMSTRNINKINKIKIIALIGYKLIPFYDGEILSNNI